MAKQFVTITNIKLFGNDTGTATHGNSKWTPYKNGEASDILFKGNGQYSVKLFDNGDGTLGLNISEVIEGEGPDGELKPIGQVTAPTVKRSSTPPAMSMDDLDDDVPF